MRRGATRVLRGSGPTRVPRAPRGSLAGPSQFYFTLRGSHIPFGFLNSIKERGRVQVLDVCRTVVGLAL